MFLVCVSCVHRANGGEVSRFPGFQHFWVGQTAQSDSQSDSQAYDGEMHSERAELWCHNVEPYRHDSYGGRRVR